MIDWEDHSAGLFLILQHWDLQFEINRLFIDSLVLQQRQVSVFMLHESHKETMKWSV